LTAGEAASAEWLFFAQRFVTCSSYADEPFVRDRSVPAHIAELDRLLEKYRETSTANRVLRFIVDTLTQRGAVTVKVLDVGVFMGTFSIAMHHVALSMYSRAIIRAYEANPVLLGGISKNLALHGVEAGLHLGAVAGQTGYFQLDSSQHLISGRLREPGMESSAAALIPTSALSEIVDFQTGVVKLDIEGWEYRAMGTLIDNPSALDNIFIIEFDCRNDARRDLASGVRYTQFLWENFEIFDVGNWNWPQPTILIESSAHLESLEARNSGANTDLVCVPRGWSVDKGALII